MLPVELQTRIFENYQLDIPYANESQAQKLDIYYPEKMEGPYPVLFSVHGGAFAFGDKQDDQVYPVLEGLKRGYAVVSVNYRLSGEAIFPAQILDCKSALRFIKENAEALNVNADCIVAWGGSAGGHLVSLLGTTNYMTKFGDMNIVVPGLQAVVDWFGPMDFLSMDEHLIENEVGVPDHSAADSPESRLMGEQITIIPEKVKAANPITYVSDKVPAFFIQHGEKDPIVAYQQSQLLYEALKVVLPEERLSFEIIPEAQHGGPHFKTEENLNKVFTFLDRVLKK